MENSLKERAMVVNLHIRVWSARKYDEKVTREIENIHNVYNVGRFNKVLMKSSTLEQIQTWANKARSIHREMTLPWGDNNDRILTTENYFNYLMKIGNCVMEFDRLSDKFAYEEYVNLKEKERERLNSMYKEEDYPHPDIIRSKFGLKAVFSPVTDADDFRLNISDSMLESIKTQMKNELENRVKVANEEILNKVREVVSKMHETLAEPGKGFKSSLIGNVEALMETVPTMNIFDDTHINEVVKMLKPLCVNYDMLKNNDSFRQDIAKKAKEILQAI